MKINIIQCKSLLTKSRLPEVEYCINPYIGCLHGCIYCYARFMKRFTGHTEKWGEFVDVKINAQEVLKKELSRKIKRGTILLGSVTDAYQLIEKKFQLTRSILDILLKHDLSISILTKSNLVIRDIDLLSNFSDCEVGLTITTLNEEMRKIFEPHSSSSQQRLKTLKTLHEAGIRTYGFVGPILPEITNLRSILIALQDKVDFIMMETLNMKCGNRQNIKMVLQRKYPRFPSLYETGLNQTYWDKVERKAKTLTNELNIPLKGFYRH